MPEKGPEPRALTSKARGLSTGCCRECLETFVGAKVPHILEPRGRNICHQVDEELPGWYIAVYGYNISDLIPVGGS